MRPPVFWILLAILCAALAMGYWLFESSQWQANVVDERGKASVSVVLTQVGFEPQYVRVTKGTVVTFTTTRPNEFWPASDPHPTHILYPAFDPREAVMASSSWSFTFDKPGNWGYHDHLRSYYTGTIYVTDN